VPDRPPHGWDEIPEGYEAVAVEEGPDWRITGELERLCSYVSSSGQRCSGWPVAALQRGTARKQWWTYCPDHTYGRWIEDGKVMHWILRKVDAGA
jgi:hypothetical protein